MIQYDESYFLPEDRDGEHLKAMEKRFWASTMESLEQVDKICQRHNITYFGYYGTLLGAVRHKGFIPWDDDMDIAMFRKDYNRFIRYAKEELEEPFHLHNVEDSCIFPLRINNTWYTQMQPEFLERFHYCPYPTGLDIYVLDKIPEEPLGKEVLKVLHQCVRFLSQQLDPRYEAIYGVSPEVVLSNPDLNEALDGLEQFTGETFVRDETLSHQLTVLAHRVAAMFNDDYSRYVTRMSLWTVEPHRENMPIHAFDQIIRVPFEQTTIPIPKEYDTILRLTYGDDYMTPIKGGGAHKATFYQEYEEQLMDIFKKCNAEPPAFLFE